MPVDVAPLPVPPHDPLVDRVRRVVVERDDLEVAFLYLRDHHPAVALMGSPAALAPGSAAVAAVVAAGGVVYGEPVTVVGLTADLEALDALLTVARPLGAGGALEVDLATIAAAAATPAAQTPAAATDEEGPPGGGAPVSREEVRAVAALVEADLVVPTGGEGEPARGRHGAALRLDLPSARIGEATAVGAFTSPYAQYHAVGPRPTATISGWALVEAIGDDADLVVDPGLPWAWRPHPDLLRRLARRSQRPGA